MGKTKQNGISPSKHACGFSGYSQKATPYKTSGVYQDEVRNRSCKLGFSLCENLKQHTVTPD